MSDFVEGMNLLLQAAEKTGERDILVGAALIANAYHERLIRAENRIQVETEMIEHVQKYIPPTMYPGDMRAETEPL